MWCQKQGDAGVALVWTEVVCSEVREHEIEVTAMVAETSVARMMAMRTMRPERDGEDRGFTVGVLLESNTVTGDRRRREDAMIDGGARVREAEEDDEDGVEELGVPRR